MDYPNTGALWTSTQKRNDKAPDMYGDIEFEKDYLLEMIEKATGMPSVKIKLDAWVKRDKNDNRMVSLKVNTYEKGAPVKSDMKDPWDD
jgi:hypothetical protein